MGGSTQLGLPDYIQHVSREAVEGGSSSREAAEVAAHRFVHEEGTGLIQFFILNFAASNSSDFPDASIGHVPHIARSRGYESVAQRICGF